MNKVNPLKQIVSEQKQGVKVGIYSACSANEYVIRASIQCALRDSSCVLIEATANQCDQNGGYTGMKPADFRDFVYKIADEIGLSKDRIFLGGDHLGPLTFASKPEVEAMEDAKELIRHYVGAGFTKIHIDTSMRVGDDDQNAPLSTAIIAKRGAELALVAETTFQKLQESNPDAIRPVYIVGSEVPIPGGAQEDEEGISVTKVVDLKETIETFHKAFLAQGLEKTWNDVVGIVVQPGVEFGDAEVHEYDHFAASELTASLDAYPNLVFEGHSTDYQTKYALKAMVDDGIAILKVGPALTFALREALFSLNLIEEEYFHGKSIKTSNLIEVMEQTMLEKPGNWQKHYHGDDNKLRLSRKYSFSDRARYYLPDEAVNGAIQTLIKNFNGIQIPYVLLSQYMPVQYTKVREGNLSNDVEALLIDRIVNCIDEYLFASRQDKLIFK